MGGQNNGGTNMKDTAEHTSSADDCCSTCASTSGCVGFTWVTANQECWLKSSIASLRSDPDVTSGSNPVTPQPPTPTPTPSPPAPTPTPPADCPGGSLSACIAGCPSDAAVYKICVVECERRCNSAV